MENKRLLLVIGFVAVLFILIIYLVFSRASLMGQLSELNPTKDTIDLINFEKCTELSKNETEWVISDCKDNIRIYLELLPGGRYYMRICGGWADGKEVVQEAKDILTVLGMNVSCDLNLTYSLMRTESDVQIYNVCGKNLYLSEGCIA